MGIGANAAARIEREHSCGASIERLLVEIAQEVAFRDRYKKELEFLERGGNPLDFDYSDYSQVSVVVSDSEAKDRKLSFVPKHGHVTELLASKLSRNGDFNEPIKQVLRRNSLPSIVRLKEEKSALPAAVPDCVVENGSYVGSKNSNPESSSVDQLENAQDANAEEKVHIEKDNVQKATKEIDHPGKGGCFVKSKRSYEETLEISRIQPVVSVANANKSLLTAPARSVLETSKRIDEETLEIAKNIQAIVSSAKKNPLIAPARSVFETSKRNDEETLEIAKNIQAIVNSANKNPLTAPARRKCHWDYVLEEMAWMANDFMQERLWKRTAAAHLCRSAAQAPFWANAKAACTSSLKDHNKDTVKLPLENYAIKFIKNTVRSPILEAPCTPELDERVSSSFLENTLHYIIPPGASEAYKAQAEDSLATSYDSISQRPSSPDSESQDEVWKRESEGFDAPRITVEKKRNQIDDELNYTKFTKKQRTAGVIGRQRAEKIPKKEKTTKANKGSDSENEWLPEAYYAEKQPKRKRDQIFGSKPSDLQASKRSKLSKFVTRKSMFRKDEFSLKPPGTGMSWSSLEDTAIRVLKHEFCSNWKLLSDILSAGSHVKGYFRSPKACEERDALLEGRKVEDFSPKGSVMFYLQHVQGPMEKDTLMFHFEEILKAKQKNAPTPMINQYERSQPHESHLESNHGRTLSPLDFCDEPVVTSRTVVKRETVPEENIAKDGVIQSAAGSDSRHRLAGNGQVTKKNGSLKQQVFKQPPSSTARQDPLQGTSNWNDDTAKIEPIQTMQLQQPGICSSSQVSEECRIQSPVPRKSLPNFHSQQGKVSGQLPPCSTSQQLPAPISFSEQHRHWTTLRPPQTNQLPAFQHNHGRSFAVGSGSQLRAASVTQWRPAPNFSHGTALRLQGQRSLKKAQRLLNQQVLQQQQQQHEIGASYLPSSIAEKPASAGFQSSVNAKGWNTQERLPSPATESAMPSVRPATAASSDAPAQQTVNNTSLKQA